MRAIVNGFPEAKGINGLLRACLENIRKSIATKNYGTQEETRRQ
jgi:hypothetical protein